MWWCSRKRIMVGIMQAWVWSWHYLLAIFYQAFNFKFYETQFHLLWSYFCNKHKSWHTINADTHQFSSVAQLCPTLCNPMNHSMPGLPVHHQLPEFTQTHVHLVSDTIQPSNPLSSSSPPAPNPAKNQGLFQRVNSSHEVVKVLEFQLQQ